MLKKEKKIINYDDFVETVESVEYFYTHPPTDDTRPAISRDGAKPKRKLLIEVEVDWENYDDVCDELIFEDAFEQKVEKGLSWRVITTRPATEQIVEAVMKEMANNQCKISSWSSHDFEWMAISSDSAKRLLTNAINKI
jgi:hypothetical protein